MTSSWLRMVWLLSRFQKDQYKLPSCSVLCSLSTVAYGSFVLSGVLCIVSGFLSLPCHTEFTRVSLHFSHCSVKSGNGTFGIYWQILRYVIISPMNTPSQVSQTDWKFRGMVMSSTWIQNHCSKPSLNSLTFLVSFPLSLMNNIHIPPKDMSALQWLKLVSLA